MTSVPNSTMRFCSAALATLVAPALASPVAPTAAVAPHHHASHVRHVGKHHVARHATHRSTVKRAVTPAVDPEALQVLKASGDAYTHLTAYSALIRSPHKMTVMAWEKSGKLNYRTVEKLGRKVVRLYAVSDGKTYTRITTADPRHYVSTPALPTTPSTAENDAAINQYEARVTPTHQPILVGASVDDFPPGTTVRLVPHPHGDVRIDGVAVDTVDIIQDLAQRSGAVHMRYRISIGKSDHLIRRLAVEVKGAGIDTDMTRRFRREEVYLKVRSTSKFAPDKFVFVPPHWATAANAVDRQATTTAVPARP